MSYSPNNPPRKIGFAYALAVYGSKIPGFFNGYAPLAQLWAYTSGDSPAQLAAPGYFTNASSLGMSVNDVVFCTTIPDGEVTPMSASQVLAAGPATITNALNFTFICTWATKPSYLTVPLGTKILVTDIGNTGGSVWQSTLTGWSPLTGSLVLANNWGSVAAPVASLTAASGVFTPVGGSGSLNLPGGMLLAGRAKLELEAEFNRTGINATGIINIFFGSAKSTADSNIYTITTTAVNNRATRPFVTLGFNEFVVTSTTYNTPGGSADGAAVDLSTNIDVSAPMGITFALASANAGDTFALIGYSLKLVQ